jgi:hypothetical protein
MMPHPAIFDVPSPARFERVQLLLRLIIMFVLGMIGVSMGWVALLLYVALPAVAAIAIQSRGADGYLAETAPALERLLRWLLSLSAYMLFLTDRFPTGGETLVRFEVRRQGTPTPGAALARLLLSLPEMLVVALLACVGSVVWLLTVVTVLVAETVPAPFLRFQRGLLRWQARLLAYHASLVDVAPPFELDGARLS